MKYIVALALTLLFAGTAMAKGGPPIPSQVQSPAEAITTIESAFRSRYPDNKEVVESPDFRIRDFVLFSLTYTHLHQGKDLGEWCWVATFRHPFHNDNSFTFRLARDGVVSLISRTE